ncbi:DUF6942 family protein [Shewanella ulleungensis]|uniref:Uncharacterized protein n=1 Tax=Shewanella ulleungensis TaxID=2282699 RepID=A0ABQ2QRP7_9GAMM|nr:hypothetical protein [Shewanella ulleungensis]MCL1151472.1 hypothetical protein [Shewanella ulleungensis]GGP91207.1 hypothetical protein GCM10009410_26630 [Shewanella ulleungensis]
MLSKQATMIVGPQIADIIFYLPTAPILPTGWQATQPDAIAKLIALNGNHWRKIVTIMAKICCLKVDITANNGAVWKSIRDNLLHDDKRILVNTKTSQQFLPRLTCQIRIVVPNTRPECLLPNNFSKDCWHIVCGKETQQRLGLIFADAESTMSKEESTLWQTIDDKNKIKRQHTCLLTPYLDYRQYSNALIEHTRELLIKTKISD